ncbi:putative membrane protein insertion efficiency factor [Trueperella bonasi]|uniref:Putative membrane protein insertion efficiency factor n=1 Tax=Trueperella bonasi TaxID=312286 RepID=A0ABT9NG19_9ACTO|nr:membrane protein insertion efficiency factor YidD [Trueperella bonasi]MDP9806346.1 putative membrane protein insertion efficiency factor [Trueperella bonasi]
MTNFTGKALSGAIRWYQRNISVNFPRRCRYQPTCSAYALESIQVHGTIKGTLLGVWRVLRCNPWSKGGVDWVPEKGKWPKKPLGYKELIALRDKDLDHQVTCDHGDDHDA